MKDYKEKYEQLTKFIKDLYPFMSDYCKEKAEGMIPELKESEDERIRNFISNELAFLRAIDSIDSDRYKEITNAIAWLKKQGEQKPEIKYIYPKFRVGDVIEPAKPNGHYVPVRVKYIGKGAYSCESDDRTAFLSLPICDENDYVLTKQKSAEWSEEDEQNFKGIINEIEANKNNAPDYDLATYNRFISWLKSLKDRVQPQPKQEWSEEDERERTRVVSILEGWLSTFKETCYAEDCKFGIEWLKSLKPQSQWKPSKEQVEALRVYLYHPQYINDSEDERIKLVESLYNNLIKLL